jgi:hypothetical protein
MGIRRLFTTLTSRARKARRQFCAGCLCLASTIASGQFFSYETTYPGVDYASGPLTDRVTRLMTEIEAGRVTLEYDAEQRGYLDSLLAALDIDPNSQFLVFSKTAAKTRFVTAQTPRALYFNDDTYVGFIQNSRTLEIAVMDPVQGPVFFDFNQDPDAPGIEREINRCLRCHDSYSMTGGGVPRFLLTSVIANPEGEIVTHEISIVTDTSTPLNRRWGGMYVTGMHGSQDIMGNFIVDDVAKLRELNLTPNGNKVDLAGYLDTASYITGGSDIVALMIVEHQVEVQNALTRLSFESRTRLYENGRLSSEELAELTRPLLESLFFVHEVALVDTITGSSGFADNFQARGPQDSQGRSLRDLNLATRIFEYPLSYLVYSEAVNALPQPVKAHLYNDIRRVLLGELQDAAFAHLDSGMREAITSILRETKPEILAQGG